jgi:hypothetical protein
VVGAHALAVHGVVRATGDLDLWVRPDPENAERAWRALARFGASLEAMGLTREDLTQPGTVYQIGLPPRRIDLLTEISGVGFDEAWSSKTLKDVEGLQIPFLGRQDLLQNKRASGRAKDLADIELLDRRDG